MVGWRNGCGRCWALGAAGLSCVLCGHVATAAVAVAAALRAYSTWPRIQTERAMQVAECGGPRQCSGHDPSNGLGRLTFVDRGVFCWYALKALWRLGGYALQRNLLHGAVDPFVFGATRVGLLPSRKQAPKHAHQVPHPAKLPWLARRTTCLWTD